MSLHDVSEFIIVAPSNMGKSIQWAERELRSYLEGHFPLFRFRIEPFGPLADDDEFKVIPIMNREPEPGEKVDPDQIFLGRLDPTIVSEIRHRLREFDPTGMKAH